MYCVQVLFQVLHFNYCQRVSEQDLSQCSFQYLDKVKTMQTDAGQIYVTKPGNCLLK